MRGPAGVQVDRQTPKSRRRLRFEFSSCHFTKATMAKSAATKKKAAAGGAKKKKAPAGGKKGKTNGAGGAGSAKKKREPKKVGRARTHGPLPKNFGTYLPRQPRGLRLGF